MQAEDQKAILAIALPPPSRMVPRTTASEGGPAHIRVAGFVCVSDRPARHLSGCAAGSALRSIRRLRRSLTMDFATTPTKWPFAYAGRRPTTAAERSFLDQLKASLGLGGDEARGIEREVDPFVAATSRLTASAAAPAATSDNDSAALDRSILNYALLNGALELLPQSWASVAIIPLQIKMVLASDRRMGSRSTRGISRSSSPLQALD